MTGPFTPEQEARIAEIVSGILKGLLSQTQQRAAADLRGDLAWSLHNAGFKQPEAGDD